nr:DUF1214 domain-containing protein [Novosphingobium panipatense]
MNQTTTPAAAPLVSVNLDNFIRVETHHYMKQAVEKGCFAQLVHARGPTPVDQQIIIRLNLDTPYSEGVFDLTSPLTITMPDPKDRFQSLLVISEDHYIQHVSYGAGTYRFTAQSIGSRFAYVFIRTFMDSLSDNDLAAGAALQDQIKVEQASIGTFEVPAWDTDNLDHVRAALLAGAVYLPDAKRAFGRPDQVDPVRRLFGTAGGWGGNNEHDAFYFPFQPADNDGETPYVLTVGTVPVDAFWSITVYNQKGYYEAPENAISVNNVTASPNEDGTVTIHFGGDPQAPNYLRIMPGWNYLVRLYRPQQVIVDGDWHFPTAAPATKLSAA